MQEEVEQKTIALSVRTARMTSIVLQQTLRKFLDAQKHKTHKLPHGKQTLKLQRRSMELTFFLRKMHRKTN